MGFPAFGSVVLIDLDEEAGRWVATHFAARGDSYLARFASLGEALGWVRDRCSRLELVDPVTHEVSGWPDDHARDELEAKQVEAMAPKPAPTFTAKLHLQGNDRAKPLAPGFEVRFHSEDDTEVSEQVWALTNTDVPAVLAWAAKHARGRATVIRAVLPGDGEVGHVRLAGVEPILPHTCGSRGLRSCDSTIRCPDAGRPGSPEDQSSRRVPIHRSNAGRRTAGPQHRRWRPRYAPSPWSACADDGARAMLALGRVGDRRDGGFDGAHRSARRP